MATLTIEAGLVYKLTTTAGLTALISTRTYLERIPQGATLPCLTYQRISTPRLLAHDTSGSAGTAHPRFQFDAWATTYSSAKAITDALRAALNGFSGTITNAVCQVETAVAVGTATVNGNITVTIIDAILAGSPLAVVVDILAGDAPADWATKVRTHLNAVGAITTVFTVGGAGANITLTRIVAAANDTSLNIAIADTGTTGITPVVTSTNTTAGVLDSVVVQAALVDSETSNPDEDAGIARITSEYIIWHVEA
jgi:hypothetical protein